jgi:hypothetical protein
MNRIEKALVAMAMAAFFYIEPGMAASNPLIDITGLWQGPNGGQLQLFQENDQINGISGNIEWAFRMEGRYVSQTEVNLIVIARNKISRCEMTMRGDITTSAQNLIIFTSFAAETSCGLRIGQRFTEQWTRVP